MPVSVINVAHGASMSTGNSPYSVCNLFKYIRHNAKCPLSINFEDSKLTLSGNATS